MTPTTISLFLIKLTEYCLIIYYNNHKDNKTKGNSIVRGAKLLLL